MADTSSVLEATPFSADDLTRAEKFTREPFVHEGEDAAAALAEDTPRRRALEDALAEIDAGREQPSVEWRRHYSLMLGLERLMAQDEPHLVDGTVLSAHQVDALSGTLIALLAEAQAGGNGQRRRAGRRQRQRQRPRRGAAVRRGRARGRRRDLRRRRAARLGPEREPTRRRTPPPPPRPPTTPTPPAASGSSTRPAPARPSPRSASPRRRAPAAS